MVQNKLTAHKIVIAQALVTVCLAATLSLWARLDAAYAALVGGGIGALASGYFAGRVFRHDNVAEPSRILRAVYVGEVMKIAITIALLLAAIMVLQVDVLFLLLGYAATLPVYWLALLLPDPRPN